MGIQILFLLSFSYLIGSIPTALLVSRKVSGEDIRFLGDGNMGARNTSRMLGWKAGLLVGCVDCFKGVVVILLAHLFQVSIHLKLRMGICAIVGHDFPIFAGFRGGQGMATMIGTFAVLFFRETMIGLIIFGLVFLLTHNFDLSAGVGLAYLVYQLVRKNYPSILVMYVIVMLITIPIKKVWDMHHRLGQEQAGLPNY